MTQEKLILTEEEVVALSSWLEIFVLQEIRMYFVLANNGETDPAELQAYFDDIQYYWDLYGRVISEETVELDSLDIQALANALSYGITDAIAEVQIENPLWVYTMSCLWKKCTDLTANMEEGSQEAQGETPNLAAMAAEAVKKQQQKAETEAAEEAKENFEPDMEAEPVGDSLESEGLE